MKTTRTLFLLSALLLMAATSMARTDIPLVKDVPKGNENDERARMPMVAPEAYMESGSLFIEFNSATPTIVSINGRNTNENYYYEQFESTGRVSINLRKHDILPSAVSGGLAFL